MHDVQRCAGDGTGSDHLEIRLHRAARFRVAPRPRVHEHRCLPTGRAAERLQHLKTRRRWCVLQSHPDAQPTCIEARFDEATHRRDLIWRSDHVAGRIEWQQSVSRDTAVAQYGHSRLDVTGGGAEVDQRRTFALGVEFRNVRGAGFQFERGGDTIHRHHTVVLVVLPMRVQIDESGAHHQTTCVDHAATAQWGRADRSNAPAANPERADRIEAGLGVDDAATADHDVVGDCLRGTVSAGQQGQGEYGDDGTHARWPRDGVNHGQRINIGGGRWHHRTCRYGGALPGGVAIVFCRIGVVSFGARC